MHQHNPQNESLLPEPDQAEELFVAFGNTLEYERGLPVDSMPDIDALLAWLRTRRPTQGTAFELASGAVTAA